jgi:hypothetical protein
VGGGLSEAGRLFAEADRHKLRCLVDDKHLYSRVRGSSP